MIPGGSFMSSFEPSRRLLLAAAGLAPLAGPLSAAPATAHTRRRHHRGYRIRYVSFDDATPAGHTLTQAWNSLGTDHRDRVYINWTSTRDDGREDTVLFRYHPRSARTEFLGSAIDAATAQGNLADGEQIPKCHPRIQQVGRRMYMTSQGFHDFKTEIDTLPDYRGSHLFSYDLATDTFSDVGRDLPGGVLIEQQGIVALAWSPEHRLLVGLSHPHGDIVLFDPRSRQVVRTVPGIPWELNRVVSREIVVTRTGKVYTYRGPEDPTLSADENEVWEYDIATDTMRATGHKLTGGFWNGQAISADRERIYLSTVSGQLYRLDVADGTFTSLGYLIDAKDHDGPAQYRIGYLYGIGLTADEEQIVGLPIIVPTAEENGEAPTRLMTYGIRTGRVTRHQDAARIVFTGSNHRDCHGNFYQAAFDWDHNPYLAVLSPR